MDEEQRDEYMYRQYEHDSATNTWSASARPIKYSTWTRNNVTSTCTDKTPNNEERSDECANVVRSALARSEDNNIVLSATIQQYYGRSIFMTRAKTN
jgi:hypothetical protein